MSYRKSVGSWKGEFIMSIENFETESKDNGEYVDLARELAETKSQMVRLRTVRDITEPDNGEIYVLGYLAGRKKPIHPKDISDIMDISTARIARLLNQLEEKKFVERTADPLNGRQTLIHLLPAGYEQHQKDTENFNQRSINFLKALGKKDAMEYVRLQKKILEIYKK